MIVEKYTPAGRIDRTPELSGYLADRIYADLKGQAAEPFSEYYRIVVRADGRIIRDTDHEFFGRQTMVPGMIVSYGKTGMAAYMHSDGFATSFGGGNHGE